MGPDYGSPLNAYKADALVNVENSLEWGEKVRLQSKIRCPNDGMGDYRHMWLMGKELEIRGRCCFAKYEPS